ncbi:MAG: hypothetical protein GY765_08120 [bacterium]|nr:hypothetical protein [bacterium]
MQQFKKKLSEFFEVPLRQREAEVQQADETFEAEERTVSGWGKITEGIRQCVLPQFPKWSDDIRVLLEPLSNIKTLNKERKRFKKTSRLPKYHRRMIGKRLRIVLLKIAIFLKTLVTQPLTILKVILSLLMAAFYIAKKALGIVLRVGLVALLIYVILKLTVLGGSWPFINN